jgi:putative membrane protein
MGSAMFFSFLLLMMIIGAIVIVALIAWGVRSSGRTVSPISALPMQVGRETPQEILARRFASGEITAEEYERARDLLGGGGKT